MDEHEQHGPLVTASEIADAHEYRMRHPLNPNSEIHFRAFEGKAMGELVGLKRQSVYTARIPPGRESFVYHRHHHEEEWMFVLSGRGVVEIDDRRHEIGPGDFLGFTAPGPAHLVKNPYEADLVILAGGERGAMEVADFPRLGKRLVRSGGRAWFVDEAAMVKVEGDGG